MRTGAVSARARKCRRSGPVRECAGGARCPRGGRERCVTVRHVYSQYSASPRRSSASRESGARAHVRLPHTTPSPSPRSTSPRAGCWPSSTPGARGRAAVPSAGRSGSGPASWSVRPSCAGWSSWCRSTPAPRVQFFSLGRVGAEPDVGRHPRGTRSGARPERTCTALAPAPAQDANTFVVTRETAERLGLHAAERPRRGRAAS